MFELFQGRADTYAVQKGDGTWDRIHQPLTPGVLARHLSHHLTAGQYVVTPDNLVHYMVIDHDINDESALRRIAQAGLELGVPPAAELLEFSGRKGYHLWVLFADWVEAGPAQDLGRAIIAQTLKTGSLDHWEIFPKQRALGKDGFGNLIKLPFGLHQRSGLPARIVGRTERIEPMAGSRVGEIVTHAREAGLNLDAISPTIISKRTVRPELKVLQGTAPLVPAVVSAPTNGNGRHDKPWLQQRTLYPCLPDMLNVVVMEGGRHQGAMAVARRIHAAFGPGTMAELMVWWNKERARPPLPDREIAEIIRDTPKYDSMFCESALSVAHCKEGCPLRMGKGWRVVGLQRMDKEPPTFNLPFENGGLLRRLPAKALLNWQEVSLEAVIQLNALPPVRKQADWIKELRPLLLAANRTAAPAIVSIEGQIRVGVLIWLQKRSRDEPSNAIYGGVWHDVENKQLVFRGDSLLSYLSAQNRLIERSRVWDVLTCVGVKDTYRILPLETGGHPERVWVLPETALADLQPDGPIPAELLQMEVPDARTDD